MANGILVGRDGLLVGGGWMAAESVRSDGGGFFCGRQAVAGGFRAGQAAGSWLAGDEWSAGFFSGKLNIRAAGNKEKGAHSFFLFPVALLSFCKIL